MNGGRLGPDTPEQRANIGRWAADHLKDGQILWYENAGRDEAVGEVTFTTEAGHRALAQITRNAEAKLDVGPTIARHIPGTEVAVSALYNALSRYTPVDAGGGTE